MNYLRIKNWSKYQHYKDRNPPWIKLETNTFQDYDFSRLHDASKLLAVCIWTLASKYKDPKHGLVPYDLMWIKNQCGLSDFVTENNLQELINKGFIQIASEVLADCKQNACPETEAETKKETYIKTPYPLKNGVLKNGRRKFCPSSLTDLDLQQAKKAAPRWDLYHLAEIYNESMGDKPAPAYPEKAFIGWCSKYTKGKEP